MTLRGWEKIFEDIVGPQRFAEVKRIAAEDDLREKLRLSAARAEPSAYSLGHRVRLYEKPYMRKYWDGIILPSHADTGADRRRVAWDDGQVSAVDVTDLELIEE